MGKLSDFPLGDYISKGFDTLVETGTGAGTGVDFARGFPFKDIWSCEIVEEQAKAMTARFRMDHRVHILAQHSPEFLDDLFTHAIAAKDRCVFWLDGHYPHADVFGKPYDYEKDLKKRLPLEGELEMLLKHGRIHDIVLVDDLRIFQKCPMQGGDLEACGLGHITRYDAPDFLAPWRETHVVEKQYRDTGYVVMMPRSTI